MKTKILSLLFLFLHTYETRGKEAALKKPVAQKQQSTQTSPNKNTKNITQDENQIISSVFTQNMPTTSIYESIIEETYGQKGLGLSREHVTHIKNSYCYLEFLVKLEKVKKDPQYAIYQTTDFKNFIEPSSTTNALMPTEELTESPAWKSIQITSQDLMTSAPWQNFIKAMICDSFDNDTTFIVDTTQANNQLFPYLPNIEMSYQDTHFTSLQLYQESLQIQSLLQDQQRQVYLNQIQDWQVSTSKLFNVITLFKQQDFYNFTHNQTAISSQKNTVVIPSQIRQDIVCYFMFMHIQKIIETYITIENISAFINRASSAKLAPNFFTYEMTDLVYIQDLLLLQKMSDTQSNQPHQSQVTMTIASIYQSNKTSTIKEALPTNSLTPLNSTQIQQATSNIIFQKIPTTSDYEKILDVIYGTNGLHIAQDLLMNIKKTYCYLEFLVKLDKVIHDKKYAQYQKTDFKDFITTNSTGAALMPTETLVASAGWKAIKYSSQDLLQSPAWQNFIKSMICDMYDTYDEFILDSYTMSDQIIDDIAQNPDFDSDPSCQQIQLSYQNIQLNHLMLENQHNTYIDQCPDWKKLDQKKLLIAMAEFKKTAFYDLTHNSPASKNPNTVQQQYTSIASPTKEQIVSYYALLAVQTSVYNLMTLDNLPSFLKAASSTELKPNFFTYQESDFIYLHDHLTVNILIDQNNKDVEEESTKNIPDSSVDDADIQSDEVSIQSIASDFKKLNHRTNVALKKMNRGTRNSLKKMNRATRKNEKKVNRIVRKRTAENKKLILAVVLTVVIVVAVAALVVATGGTASPIVAGMMAPINAAVWAGTAAASTAVSVATGAVATATAIGSTAAGIATGEITATMIATSMIEAATSAAIAATTTITGALTATAIAGSIAIGTAAAADEKFRANLMKDVFMPMMQGIQAMTDALTTGFIDISVGLTYMGCAIGQGLGYPVNATIEMNKVKIKMEKYRSTINIAMSVVVTIIITVVVMACVAGAGVAYAYAIDSGMFGAQASATAAESAALDAALVSNVAQKELSAAQTIENTTTETGGNADQITAAKNARISAESKAAKAQDVAEKSASKAKNLRSTALQDQNITSKETQSLDEKITQATENQNKEALAAAKKKASDSQLTMIQRIMGKVGPDVAVTDLEITQSMVEQEAARLDALTLFQQAERNGFTTALKDNILSWSFAIGQAFNGVFGIFGAMGAAHQDQLAAQQAQEEKISIQSLWKFVEDTKVNVTTTQNSFIDELNKKYQFALENQAFGLQYYHNFLHGSVNLIENQISYMLAQQQINLLTPDNNGLCPADIGSTWGLKTAFKYLYPSQGFISTTLGRTDFPYAQEVAQAPLTSPSNSQQATNLVNNDSSIEKLWFNQRAITTLQQSQELPLDVEIRVRIIYTLTTSYHFGLYLGGTYQDYNSPTYIEELKNTNQINLDSAHLAKMFIVQRDNQHTSPSLGLYENEGKGWIISNEKINKPIDTVSIYHMKAHLDKNQLTVSFWTEQNPTQVWSQSVTVNPCDQRTFGVIFSGIALEWGVVSPSLTIQENQQVRPALNITSEINREKESKATWKKLMQPQFGFIKMQAINKIHLLQGKYLYTTQDTGLLDQHNNPITDYIVYATIDNTGQQISNIGQSPQALSNNTTTPNAILSLVTGNVYDISRKIIARKNNSLEMYTQTKRINKDIVNMIATNLGTYTTAQQISNQQNPTSLKNPAIGSQTIALTSVNNSTPPTNGGVQIGLTTIAPTTITATKSTINQLQTLAAGSAQIQTFTLTGASGLSL